MENYYAYKTRATRSVGRAKKIKRIKNGKVENVPVRDEIAACNSRRGRKIIIIAMKMWKEAHKAHCKDGDGGRSRSKFSLPRR